MNKVLSTYDSSAAQRYLSAAYAQYGKSELAKRLGYSERHLQRWLKGEISPSQHILEELQSMLDFYHVPTANHKSFTFIDLFAGIGGIRNAFESIDGQCVYTSEWDDYAQKTYACNYPSNHIIAGDITTVESASVPDHDVLLAGFPCQPFSIAGVSKKISLGREHGFNDQTQGTLFFDVARIIQAKRPKAFLLENVKNLQSHDKGRTFDVIYRTLTQDLGYHVHYKVISGAHFVPQMRERIIIVGFRDKVNFTWDDVYLPEKGVVKLNSVLHSTIYEPYLPWDGAAYYDFERKCVQDKYTLTDNLWAYLQNYKKKHQAAGNGFGFGMVTKDSIARTLSARYYKDGSEILVYQGEGCNPRRLTPRECARLMGFPDSFKIPVSDTRAYKQFGNSVVVPVMRAVANAIKPHLGRSIN